jgi:hypothetical protein
MYYKLFGIRLFSSKKDKKDRKKEFKEKKSEKYLL